MSYVAHFIIKLLIEITRTQGLVTDTNWDSWFPSDISS